MPLALSPARRATRAGESGSIELGRSSTQRRRGEKATDKHRRRRRCPDGMHGGKRPIGVPVLALLAPGADPAAAVGGRREEVGRQEENEQEPHRSDLIGERMKRYALKAQLANSAWPIRHQLFGYSALGIGLDTRRWGWLTVIEGLRRRRRGASGHGATTAAQDLSAHGYDGRRGVGHLGAWL
uniref:Uncharacterized protein n=1 Tax=Oryza glumipatula TaxID=40148 RepID=A0A0D9ZY15_9ORYZ